MSEITPVPSATVTLVRDSNGGVEVLMMQRRLKSVFVPGMYVFPGGAVDEQDHAPALYELCPQVSDEQASEILGIERGGLDYWVAAIRESFEEAGLLVAYDKDGELLVLDHAAAIERYRQHRRALNAGACTLLEILRNERLTLAVDRLVYFSHWITPVSAPRRYDTRFFVAAAPPAQSPLHDNQETISHVWVRAADALARHHAGDFKMRFPTVRTLEEFADFADVETLINAMRAKRNIPTILPRIRGSGARVLPGDPSYDDVSEQEAHGKWKP